METKKLTVICLNTRRHKRDKERDGDGGRDKGRKRERERERERERDLLREIPITTNKSAEYQRYA